MSDVKKCPHCGKEIHSTALYCMFCMTSLTPKKDITPPPVPRRKKWTVTAIVVLTVAILLVMVLIGKCAVDLIGKFINNRDEAANTPGTENTEQTDDTSSTEENTQEPQVSEEETESQTSEDPTKEDMEPDDPTKEDAQPQTPENPSKEELETGGPEPEPSTDPTPAKPVCSHYYITASCIAPMTCQKCGDTVGTADASAHIWKPITSVIHHDEVGHYEEVEKYYKKTEYLCFFCGYNQKGYDSLDALRQHISVHSGATNYDAIVSAPDLHADTREVWATRTEQQYVVDKEAYDETVTTGYICTVCNKQKAP